MEEKIAEFFAVFTASVIFLGFAVFMAELGVAVWCGAKKIFSK